MTAKPIAFTGPFADVNFGDYGMLVNNIHSLGLSDVVLFGYGSDFLAQIADHYLHSVNVTVIEIECDPSGIERYSRIDMYTPTPFELLGVVRNLDVLRAEISSIDTLVVNGGGYLNGLWSMQHRFKRLLQILAPVLVAHQLGKRIIFTGNGFGPFGPHRAFFSSMLSHLHGAIFCTRDELYSPAALRSLGISHTQILPVPDDLYFLEDVLWPTPSSEDSWGPYVVLETYLSVTELREIRPSLEKFYEARIVHANRDLVLLPFNLGSGGVDQAQYLASLFPEARYIDIEEKGYLPLEDAQRFIMDAELVVGNRYHAQVFALANATPTVTVLRDVLGDKRYYYNKCRGMLDVALAGSGYDERLYLQHEMLDAMALLTEDYDNVVQEQRRVYGRGLERNRILHQKRRENLMGMIRESHVANPER